MKVLEEIIQSVTVVFVPKYLGFLCFSSQVAAPKHRTVPEAVHGALPKEVSKCCWNFR